MTDPLAAGTAWDSLRAAATERPSRFLDMFGVWESEEDGGWCVRDDQDRVVVFGSVDDALDVLVDALERRFELSDRIGDFAVRREVLRQAALEHLGRRAQRQWETVARSMAAEMTNALVAVPVRGVFSSVCDHDGAAAPIRSGRLLAGYLDEELEAAASQLAREYGLVGFRFSSASWWTEDLMTAKEDEQIGQELLEAYADDGTHPPFVIVVHVDASGPAAELQAVLCAEAVLGALVLLDHSPGDWWPSGGPSILGMSEVGAEGAAGAAPQVVDGRAIRDDSARNEIEFEPVATGIDAGAHLAGPGQALLDHLVDDEPLAACCRLALHAAATWSPEPRYASAAAAVRILLQNVERAADYDDDINDGARWRAEHDSEWPARSGPTYRDEDGGPPAYDDLLTSVALVPPGLDLTRRAIDAGSLLDAVQHLLFARASTMRDRG